MATEAQSEIVGTHSVSPRPASNEGRGGLCACPPLCLRGRRGFCVIYGVEDV